MAKKMIKYQVQTTRGIANEMCRYEGGKIVAEKLLKPADPRWVERTKSDPDERNIYIFTIETPYFCEARWRSFLVRPTVLEGQKNVR